VDDLVVGVAEVVEFQPLGVGHVRLRLHLHGDDEDVLVQDVVVLDVRPQGQRGGGPCRG
jgi:hypothetical protein